MTGEPPDSGAPATPPRAPVPRGAGAILAPEPPPAPPAPATGPLHVASLSLLRPGRIRRILTLAGLPPRLGLPGQEGLVGVWGMGRTAGRAQWLAARSGAARVWLEDAWLRSIHPGRVAGEPPLGLLIDRSGLHHDPAQPSDLEQMLATHPLDDTGLIARAHAGMARLMAADLSKYNAHDLAEEAPTPGYVLVIDQTRGDASVRSSGADAARFHAMLAQARAEHPGAPIVLRAHPETTGGARPGHFTPQDATGPNDVFLTAPVSPWRLLEGARAVYTVSSQMGFEAILAGHRPRVFGEPFYAGWGLTEDELSLPRRHRRLSRAQLFAAAMLLYPVWYDPCRDRLCDFETAMAQLEAERRAYLEDGRGHVALGMRLWKRRAIQQGFGRWRAVRFADTPARAAALAKRSGRGLLVWGRGSETLGDPGVPVLRVEDGFLRSRGLGAALVPALSLVTDDRGIYYDPRTESRLERLIAAPLPPGGRERAEALITFLTEKGLSKYNPDAATPDLSGLPEGPRILVPGQVEDDASIILGAPGSGGNLGLLQAVRAARPEAVILFKPHPDVEAGLRPGRIAPEALAGLADRVVGGTDPAALLGQVDEVWTLTSGLGFEALLRGLPVTCLGTPFYAGWGLTRDLGRVPGWRQARPDLAALVHATLIAYPRYFDPITGRPCPVELVAERLAEGRTGPGRPGLRLLARLQGLLAGQAWIWRGR